MYTPMRRARQGRIQEAGTRVRVAATQVRKIIIKV